MKARRARPEAPVPCRERHGTGVVATGFSARRALRVGVVTVLAVVPPARGELRARDRTVVVAIDAIEEASPAFTAAPVARGLRVAGGLALGLVELAVLVGIEARDQAFAELAAMMAGAGGRLLAGAGGTGEEGEEADGDAGAHGGLRWWCRSPAHRVPGPAGLRVWDQATAGRRVSGFPACAAGAVAAPVLGARIPAMDAAMDDAERKEARLKELLRRHDAALVAFSGGVDSTYLLDVAVEVLGDRVTAVTADSPSLARSTLAEATAFCAARGIAHRIVPTAELEQEAYAANDGRRCYHCKAELMRAMRAVAAQSVAGAALLVGAIAEDFGDVRPGLQAAAEGGAAWPLADAGFTKPEVRARSRDRALPTWDRPAEPCLASRVPYGERVDPAVLAMIEGAERELRALGLRECRARHHRIGGGRGHLCRIEVPDADLAAVLAMRAQLLPRLRALGYANVCLDLAGLQSGGFNRLLGPAERAAALPPTR